MVLSVLRSYWFLSLSFRLGVGNLNITVPVKVTLADKARFWRERLSGASILQRQTLRA